MSCVEGYVDVVRFIISVTGDVNLSKCSTFLPLHGACLGGQLEVVTLLIEKGEHVLFLLVVFLYYHNVVGILSTLIYIY
jgi:ankyrin repeat protein